MSLKIALQRLVFHDLFIMFHRTQHRYYANINWKVMLEIGNSSNDWPIRANY